MKLENLLRDIKRGLLTTIFCGLLSTCFPNNLNLDVPSTGMIVGKVFGVKVENNKVYYEGVSEAYISLFDFNFDKTGFYTRSVSGGVYSLDKIPTGSYNVYASGYQYAESDTKPITVLKQQTTQVEDLTLENKTLYGKAYKNDKISPLGNQKIRINNAAYGYSLITTSLDGSYAFEDYGSPAYCQIKISGGTNDGKILKFMDSDSDSFYISDHLKSVVINKDIYLP